MLLLTEIVLFKFLVERQILKFFVIIIIIVIIVLVFLILFEQAGVSGRKLKLRCAKHGLSGDQLRLQILCLLLQNQIFFLRLTDLKRCLLQLGLHCGGTFAARVAVMRTVAKHRSADAIHFSKRFFWSHRQLLHGSEVLSLSVRLLMKIQSLFVIDILAKFVVIKRINVIVDPIHNPISLFTFLLAVDSDSARNREHLIVVFDRSSSVAPVDEEAKEEEDVVRDVPRLSSLFFSRSAAEFTEVVMTSHELNSIERVVEDDLESVLNRDIIFRHIREVSLFLRMTKIETKLVRRQLLLKLLSKPVSFFLVFPE